MAGVALNIYGSDYENISSQYTNQLNIFGSSSKIPTVIIELGPVRNGSAVSNCEADQKGWQDASADIVKGIMPSIFL